MIRITYNSGWKAEFGFSQVQDAIWLFFNERERAARIYVRDSRRKYVRASIDDLYRIRDDLK